MTEDEERVRKLAQDEIRELRRLAQRDVKMAYVCAGASMILAVVSLVLGGVSTLG